MSLDTTGRDWASGAITMFMCSTPSEHVYIMQQSIGL